MSPQAAILLVEQIAPRLRATTRQLPQVGADDTEELYQDGLAMAAEMLVSAESRGKRVTPGNIAWYARKRLASGRRSTGGGRSDALCPAAVLDGNSRPTPLRRRVPPHDDGETGDCVGGDDSAPLPELMSGDAEDPARAAARNLDWEQFLGGLDDLSRRMVLAFARGETMRDLKAGAGLSDSGMSARKRRLAAALREALGSDCLAEAGRDPDWRAEIVARREKEAFRQDPVGFAGA